MVFSSEVFLFLFLPVVYLLYLAIPNLKARNILLIIVSMVFYAYGEPAAVLLMILSVICNYFFGRAMANERCKKPMLIVSVVFNVSILFADLVPSCGFSKKILKYRPLSDKIKGNGFICNIINERYEDNEEDNGIVIGGVTGGRKLYNGFCG